MRQVEELKAAKDLAMGVVLFILALVPVFPAGSQIEDGPDESGEDRIGVQDVLTRGRGSDLLNVKYVGAYDGDTIRIEIPNVPPVFSSISVRLYGIDAPERNGHCEEEITKALAAWHYLRDRLQRAKRIDLIDVRKDMYFRLRAVVLVDGINVANDMLHLALVRHYDGGKRQPWCSPERMQR